MDQNTRTTINVPAKYVTLAALTIGVLLSGCQHKQSRSVPGSNLRMGNPSNATAKASNRDNYLIQNKYFALSYNNSKGTPNWVSWRLTQSDIGSAERVPFYPDEHLPRGFQQVTPGDYTGFGFDRGHMCPHGDRSADDTMSESTFVMTNIIPQSPPLNQQTWAGLESYCRDLAQQGNVLYIVDGPYGQGGEGRDGFMNTIGNQNTVTVPSKCWKVIMVLDKDVEPQNVPSNTRLISVIMPNTMKVTRNWAGYRVPVSRVEELTGYRFFDKVPSSIIDPLKKKVDKVKIPKTKPIKYGRGARNQGE